MTFLHSEDFGVNCDTGTLPAAVGLQYAGWVLPCELNIDKFAKVFHRTASLIVLPSIPTAAIYHNYVQNKVLSIDDWCQK